LLDQKSRVVCSYCKKRIVPTETAYRGTEQDPNWYHEECLWKAYFGSKSPRKVYNLPYKDKSKELRLSVEYYRNQEKYLSTPYKIGRAFEYSVMEHLRRRGWYCIRKFASIGEEDLVAILDRGVNDQGVKVSQVWFIQCKFSKHGMTKPEDMTLEERRKLVEKANKYGAYAIFAGVQPPGTRPRLYFRFLEDFQK